MRPRILSDLGILLFREHGDWCAVWTKFDFMAWAPTREAAVEKLLMDIVVASLLDRNEGRPAFSTIAAPPPELVAQWEAAAAAEPVSRGSR